MPLKVALDARGLQPGFKSHLGRGIGRYSKNLIRAMLEQEASIRFRLILQKGLAEPDLPLDLPRCYLPSSPGWLPGDKRLIAYHALPALKLSALLKDSHLVHFLSHLDAPALIKVPAVITVHDLIFQRLKELYRPKGGGLSFDLKRWLETRCLPRARRLIAVSGQTKQDLMELYGIAEGRISVIAEGTDPELQPAAETADCARVLQRLGLDEPFFLYLGGIDQRKGLKYLLEALASLREKELPCHLALAGSIKNDAQYPALLAQIERLDLQAEVHLLGYVPDEELPALFACCLAFVFPSLYEGFGLPPLEAMACGAPVIAAEASAVPEVVGQAGILVKPGDAGELLRAMVEIALDPKLHDELKQKGARRAREFTWERAARATLALYEECAG